jgi:SSS family solute:Na+ symporter
MASSGVALSAVDLTVIGIYFVAILAHGLWSGRGERSSEDYFLAGRALPWYLIGLSFYASNMSGASFVGLMGAAYQEGMTVFNYEWTATLVLLFFAVFMLPTFLRARLFTLPEYLELRYDRRVRWAYSAFTILALMLIDTAGALYAGGVVLEVVWPELDLWLLTAILALVSGVYTIFGGLRAVVRTDAVQALLMILGAGLIFLLGLEAIGGWDQMMAGLAPEKRELLRPAGDAFLPWPGVLGVVILGFYYWTLNQYFVQRALAARSLSEGRRGALFGGFLKLPNILLMILPGLIAIQLFPDLDNPDQVFPRLAFELLPVGLRGLILTALIAAIMSSLDSALNAAASLLTMDFVKPLRPGTSERALLWIGRAFTALLMIVAAVYAPVIQSFGSLFQYFQSTLAYLVPAIVAVYLGGLFLARPSAGTAFWTLAVGCPLGLAVFLFKEVFGAWTALGLPDLHFTYMALLLAGAALGFLVLFAGPAGSAVTDPSAAARYRRGDATLQAGASWWRDERILVGGLIGLLLGLLLLLA